LDTTFTYAYTLCGHEYMASDDLDKALVLFRNAMRMDERHYNAWYGLGMIYYRQEKYELAEYHFRRAITINNTSSVLYCYLGMVNLFYFKHTF
jgi:anaphase-promoting complex subunit 3